LAHHSKKVVVASFVTLVIWTHQVLAVAVEANFLAGATYRTSNTTVLLSLLSIVVSFSYSLGHVQRVLAHKQASNSLDGLLCKET
jgi:hypothetical protein